MEEQTTRYGVSKNEACETWLFSSRLITFGVTCDARRRIDKMILSKDHNISFGTTSTWI